MCVSLLCKGEGRMRRLGSKEDVDTLLYHRGLEAACWSMPGEIEFGGLAIRMPVVGLTMGIALRLRTAAGSWSLT